MKRTVPEIEAIEDFNGAVDGIKSIYTDYGREGMTDETGAPWAMYRLFEIIQRASLKISGDLQTARPDIPWEILLKPRHNFIAEFRSNGDDILDIDTMWQTASMIIEKEKLVNSI